MKTKGLNKVGLIFEKIEAREVLTKAFNMSTDGSFSRFLNQD